MRRLALDVVQHILCLGAHADDIEIGCGATILSLLQRYPSVRVRWVVLSGMGVRAEEAQDSARHFLAGAINATVDVRDFRDGYFPWQGGILKDYFEQLKSEPTPDVVFTHHGHDLHQDHRLVSELTWNTFRDHLILEYEVPKYDGGLGSPNVFVPQAIERVDQKLHILQKCFPSQSAKPWFDVDTFRALMRLRGVECNAPSRFAEAFYARKVCLEIA